MVTNQNKKIDWVTKEFVNKKFLKTKQLNFEEQTNVELEFGFLL